MEKSKLSFQKITNKLNQFPLPMKPKDFGEEYEFPNDIAGVSSNTLGKWLFKLSAWKGYTLRTLAYSEMRNSILEDNFHSIVSQKMAGIKSDKKIVKEAMIGQIINENDDIEQLQSDLIERKSYTVALKRLVELYSVQIDVISREISRRGMEAKYHGIPEGN